MAPDEPAAESGVGDDTAPPPAHDGGVGEARGIAWRQAEEDLLDELIQQCLHAACLASPNRASGGGEGLVDLGRRNAICGRRKTAGYRADKTSSCGDSAIGM